MTRLQLVNDKFKKNITQSSFIASSGTLCLGDKGSVLEDESGEVGDLEA